MTENLSAFPTVLENVRTLIKVLDLSSSDKKKLDEKVHDKNITPKLMWEFIQNDLFTPLWNLLEKDIAEQLCHYLAAHFQAYLGGLVTKIPVDGLSRKDLIPILAEHYFSVTAHIFLSEKIPQNYCFPDLKRLLAADKRSVETVLEWLDDDSDWQTYVADLNSKEQKDKLNRWKSSDYLFSYTELKLLKRQKGMEKAVFWLFVARGLDAVRRMDSDGLFFKGINRYQGVEKRKEANSLLICNIREKQQDLHKDILESIASIFNELNLKKLAINTEKNTQDKDEAFREINIARAILQHAGRLQEQSYHLDCLEARWHLFSGNLEQAVELYEKAFYAALFQAGGQLEQIIRESLLSAAFLETAYKKGSRKFLAHLKNAAIVFGYELPSVDSDSVKINHQELVAEWEVDMWARNFGTYFPKQGWFPGTDYPVMNWRSVDLSLTLQDDLLRIKPDYAKPDRTVSIGNGTKRMPQLVWFSSLDSRYPQMIEENETELQKLLDSRMEILKKLLDKGADVNKLSSVNESALLFALEHLNLCDSRSSRDQNRAVFDLISQYPHKSETVNAQTSKQQKFPLMLAVESGRADVVQKVLEMGAEVDMQSSCNPLTPLYRCMTMLLKLMHKERNRQVEKESFEHELKYGKNKQSAEYVRRSLNEGTIFHSELSMPYFGYDSKKAEFIDKLTSVISEIEYAQLSEYSSVEELHKIVDLLLKAGANPNMPHTPNNTLPLEGYTPLMLAIENNDAVAFEKMLHYGGDIHQPAYSYGRLLYCDEIKHYWGSDKIKGLY